MSGGERQESGSSRPDWRRRKEGRKGGRGRQRGGGRGRSCVSVALGSAAAAAAADTDTEEQEEGGVFLRQESVPILQKTGKGGRGREGGREGGKRKRSLCLDEEKTERF